MGVAARAVAMLRTLLISPAVEATERASTALMKAEQDWGTSASEAARAFLLEFSRISTFFLASASWVLAASPVAIVALAAWQINCLRLHL